jgi:hypothetical protein
MSERQKAMALLAAGVVLGALITSAPAQSAGHALAPSVIAQLKKIFLTKAEANQRFYTKSKADGRFLKAGAVYSKAEVDGKLGALYTKTEVDGKLGALYTKAEVDGKVTPLDSALAADLAIATANGVGNELGCAGGTLAIAIKNAKSEARDARFTFQVPGAAPAYGHIRSDGSIRQSSANVTSVTHTAGTGVYCIVFSVAMAQAALESAGVSLHVS